VACASSKKTLLCLINKITTSNETTLRVNKLKCFSNEEMSVRALQKQYFNDMITKVLKREYSEVTIKMLRKEKNSVDTLR
jgi:hypothetical protein